MYTRVGKRLLDMLLAGGLLALVSPIMLLTAVAIWMEDGTPVFFRQSRTGRDGQPFKILKFRSMARGTAHLPSAAQTTAQITRVGGVVRRLNIDELPQLLNILRGDMSLVGPRPPLPTQTDLIALRDGDTRALRPGLTGLAQVNAFDGMSSAQKAALDNQYARRVSLGTDLAILARTASYLARRPPVY